MALRLPRAREELRMALYAGASVLETGGRILLYGAKDEGIRAAPGSLTHLFAGVRTLGIGGHCRVVEARRAEGGVGPRGCLEAWRETVELGFPGLPSVWVSYPGVFAHGRLDPGTRLLVESLPPFASGARVLDYGCGSGVVGGVARARNPGVRVELLDVDAVALEAARENVPGARVLLRDGLPPREEGPWDAILSNPPFHRGKAEEPEMILDLVREVPGRLDRKGRLILVAQRRLALEEILARWFRMVELRSEGGGYRVWEGREPLREG